MNQSAECRKHSVATRSFHTASGTEILAVIYEPVMLDAGRWKCEFAIIGLPEIVEADTCGVDSMQALEMSFDGIRSHLEKIGETLTWLDGEPGYLGIARKIPDSYGLAIEAHLAQLVSDEVTRILTEDAKAKGVRWPPGST